MDEGMLEHRILNYVRGIGKALEDEWQCKAKELGLTFAEQHAMWIIFSKQKISISEIATLGLWNRSTVMQMMTRLAKKEIISMSKDAKDLRVTYVELTEKGDKKREESLHKEFKVLNFIKEKWDNDPVMMEYVAEFSREFNLHFHGKEFVDWVGSATKSNSTNLKDK
ncbi:transcriptional regulator, SarA/Rot family [Salipaludibacillus sp. CF4.18]|uniref:transcriptional regulator, SarA/Rot family n=1 Tax=Salipaludibacillus sp. CF4.18 TaxID=3373081 RepID=UPI003EE78410